MSGAASIQHSFINPQAWTSINNSLRNPQALWLVQSKHTLPLCTVVVSQPNHAGLSFLLSAAVPGAPNNGFSLCLESVTFTVLMDPGGVICGAWRQAATHTQGQRPATQLGQSRGKENLLGHWFLALCRDSWFSQAIPTTSLSPPTTTTVYTLQKPKDNFSGSLPVISVSAKIAIDNA